MNLIKIKTNNEPLKKNPVLDIINSHDNELKTVVEVQMPQASPSVTVNKWDATTCETS